MIHLIRQQENLEKRNKNTNESCSKELKKHLMLKESGKIDIKEMYTRRFDIRRTKLKIHQGQMITSVRIYSTGVKKWDKETWMRICKAMSGGPPMAGDDSILGKP